jgi:hypothetical protein
METDPENSLIIAMEKCKHNINCGEVCVVKRKKYITRPKYPLMILNDRYEYEPITFSIQNGVTIEYTKDCKLGKGINFIKWLIAMELYSFLGISLYSYEPYGFNIEYLKHPYIGIAYSGITMIENNSKEDWKSGDRIIARFCWNDEEVYETKELRRIRFRQKDRVPFIVERFDPIKHVTNIISKIESEKDLDTTLIKFLPSIEHLDEFWNKWTVGICKKDIIAGFSGKIQLPKRKKETLAWFFFEKNIII